MWQDGHIIQEKVSSLTQGVSGLHGGPLSPSPPSSILMIPNSPFTLQAYQVKKEGDVSSLSENF